MWGGREEERAECIVSDMSCFAPTKLFPHCGYVPVIPHSIRCVFLERQKLLTQFHFPIVPIRLHHQLCWLKFLGVAVQEHLGYLRMGATALQGAAAVLRGCHR